MVRIRQFFLTQPAQERSVAIASPA